jgi:hypothetical protein
MFLIQTATSWPTGYRAAGAALMCAVVPSQAADKKPNILRKRKKRPWHRKSIGARHYLWLTRPPSLVLMSRS